MRVLIVANGIKPLPHILLAAAKSADTVIAADGGYSVLRSLDLIPHCVIGDMDSLTEDQKSEAKKLTEYIEFSHDKDLTDLELAIMQAGKIGGTEILLMGVAGRSDHLLVNLTAMASCPGTIKMHVPEGPIRAVVPGIPFKMSVQPGTLVSLCAWGGTARRIKTYGLDFTYNRDDLEVGGRGIENVATEGEVRISLEEGTLIVWVLSDSPDLLWA
jgi:thiamine pyrophosphokinase